MLLAPWFAVWTRSRHEQIVYNKLVENRIEAFLPTIPRISRWKDRKKRINWPLFPGYCFARFAHDQSFTVLRCPGVANVVSFDGAPAPIPDHEIESLRRLVTSDLQYDPCPLMREGMMVEVVRGPLTGVAGRLVRKNATHGRLVLSVDLIGHGVSVNVDVADVKAY